MSRWSYPNLTPKLIRDLSISRLRRYRLIPDDASEEEIDAAIRRYEMRDIVEELHPELFPPEFRFECDGGWRKIILDYIDDVSEIAPRLKLKFSIVKEKFGTLRVHTSTVKSRTTKSDYWALRAAFDRAEKRSVVTCEVCGAPAQTRVTDFYKTLCDKHFECMRHG